MPGDSMTPGAIELRGGPLHGVIHELPHGLPRDRLPDRFALPDPERGQRHWYKLTADGLADFVHSETWLPAEQG